MPNVNFVHTILGLGPMGTLKRCVSCHTLNVNEWEETAMMKMMENERKKKFITHIHTHRAIETQWNKYWHNEKPATRKKLSRRRRNNENEEHQPPEIEWIEIDRAYGRYELSYEMIRIRYNTQHTSASFIIILYDVYILIENWATVELSCGASHAHLYISQSAHTKYATNLVITIA